MHKDGNCKEVMKKIKQQWGSFTEEDIAKNARIIRRT